MPAQTLRAEIFWKLGKGTVGDITRDHQSDLENYATLAAANLVERAGEVIGYEIRTSTQSHPEGMDARIVDFWVPTVVGPEVCTRAFESTSDELPLLVPRECWVFSDDAEGYEKWHEARLAEGGNPR